MEATHRLSNVIVDKISLVKRGANQKTIIWKSEKPSENPSFQKTIAIEKTDVEKRMVYGIVYAPNEADSEGDSMETEEILKMCHAFMKDGRTQEVDKDHDYVADEGFIAESWIVKKGDPIFKEIDAWAVGIFVEDDATWEEVKKGEITGLSMAGLGERNEIEKKETWTEVAKKFFQDVTSGKGGFSQYVKKDFAENIQHRAIYEALDAFTSAVYESLYPEFEGNIQESILKNLDQFKSYIENSETFNITKGESEMDEKAIQEAIEKAVAPMIKKFDELTKTVEDLQKSNEEYQTKNDERIEKVEKESPGSQHKETHVEKKAVDEPIWTQ